MRLRVVAEAISVALIVAGVGELSIHKGKNRVQSFMGMVVLLLETKREEDMRILFAVLCVLFFSASSSFANTIVVDLTNRVLTYNGVTYPVATPRPGASRPVGQFTILQKREWPSWTPTANMRRRDPSLRAMRGGPRNPLGARALYLYRNGAATMYRIHGTNDPSSIGRAASSGCIRMHNDDVIKIFASAPIGTRVIIR